MDEPEDPAPQPGETTLFLKAFGRGDDAAGERLAGLIHHELRGLAEGYLRRERADHTLQPTALVNEAWVRLIDQSETDWEGRSHFLSIAAIAMRRVLVDHARARLSAKRGGGAQQETLHTQVPDGFEQGVDILALNEGLDALKEHSERAAKVVELRFFGGLSESEAARVLGVDRSTVKRDWRIARAWLTDHLGA